MAERGKMGVTILASVLISLVLTTGVIYILNPYLFPKTPSKGVLQTQTLSLTSDAKIFGSQTSAYTVVNQTQLTIVTSGGSFLDVRFTAQAYIGLDSGFSGSAEWWVAVFVNSTSGLAGNRTVLVHFMYAGAPVGFPRDVPTGLSIECVTSVLAKATYNVTVQWISKTPQGGNTYLFLDDSTSRAPRDLVAQEIVP